jgi:hypothetical protein
MHKYHCHLLCQGMLALLLCFTMHIAQARNVLVFVADGLRPGTVNQEDAPTLTWVREQGVSFTNSHSLFPTFTTPNASAIATGHYLGDTGDFSNTIYLGYRLFNTDSFGKSPVSSTPFIEYDDVLGDMNDHFEGNYIGEASLLAAARAQGYHTAAIGKLGPTAIQDVTQVSPVNGRFAMPKTIIIDDATGTTDAPPLEPEVATALRRAGLPLVTPARVQPSGDSKTPGTLNANEAQQSYFAKATASVVLPLLRQRSLQDGQPFVLVYWSRDPDGTQHNQGDSLNSLVPGINGPTSKAAIRQADDNLRQLLDALRANPKLWADTDVVVTSDHGFATIGKRDVNAQHRATTSFSARQHYHDVPTGFLPPGFLAMDLAEYLQQPLFDPDLFTKDERGNPVHVRIVAGAKVTTQQRAHPYLGNGLIGGSDKSMDQTDAKVVVTAGGGSDLIYLPRSDAALARRIAAFLLQQDYVGALFVDDQYGKLPGTLPLSSIALVGSARTPRPALVVSFKTFSLDAKETGIADPLLNAVQIADTTLQQGQGMHGSFGRDNTFNFMAALGPDFKTRYQSALPASNADIAPTLMQILKLQPQPRGKLLGRVLTEALQTSEALPANKAAPARRCVLISSPASDGRRTVLEYQTYQGRLYFDRASLLEITAQEKSGCARR